MYSCTNDDKGIVYNNRVLIGNWYEASKLEEHKLKLFLDHMKKGDLTLARYRQMDENLNRLIVLTQSTGVIHFGATVTLLAPYVPCPIENDTGVVLGGHISSSEIVYSQDLEDGCILVGLPDKTPRARSSFVIFSADYCNRENEPLTYNKEFLLATIGSVEKKKPLYVRYDPSPVPGLLGAYQLYLSEHPVSDARWRILPVQSPDITRFEQEGHPVKVNTDMIINHCATNINLGINTQYWAQGFFGKICAPLMKTCLDVYGRELPNNIWQFYVPITG